MAKIVIFSGAGISAESGLSTFRDSGGLWEEYDVKDVCSVGSLEKDRSLVNSFYDRRREELENVRPNKAHEVIAALKSRYPDDIDVITQNVDDLFERAGCKEVEHVHGYLTSIRCEACSYRCDIGHTKLEKSMQTCPKCGASTRPDVVFFGEEAPRYKALYAALKDCRLFIVIGTSGLVVDVTYLRRGIKYSLLNNLGPSQYIKTRKFTKVLYKPATQAIDEIAGLIEELMQTDKIEVQKRSR